MQLKIQMQLQMQLQKQIQLQMQSRVAFADADAVQRGVARGGQAGQAMIGQEAGGLVVDIVLGLPFFFSFFFLRGYRRRIIFAHHRPVSYECIAMRHICFISGG